MDNSEETKREKSKCKYCFDCKEKHRQHTQQNRLGRKVYYCENEDAMKLPREVFGNKAERFIGFGDMTFASPLTTKTAPKWCPKNRKPDHNKGA